ncbi:MAG: prepilin-type N-terminal cleavage/methylation domain-containing protein [Bacilli bacterium]|nr:prepilin-type N-terminal cleavage/methylation domain-containing protein [Bacilli bacterium]
MKKGFTLIELLAVIIILAVIALIATPMILGIIKTAKEGSAEASALGYIDSLEKSIVLSTMSGTTITGEYNVSDLSDIVKMKGEAPTKGNVIIASNGEINSGTFCINNYKVSYDGSKANVVANNCDDMTEVTTPETPEIPETPSYEIGSAIYFNPETGLTCTAGEAVSINDTKTGCMKWHILNNNESNDTFDLILDHNTTAKFAWYPTAVNTTGPSTTFLERLKSDTSSWAGVPTRTDSYSLSNGSSTYTINYSTYKARLITAQEVAKLTGNSSFNEVTSGKTSYFFLNNNTATQTAFTPGASTYAWLFDYTSDCTSAGCNTAYAYTTGYWTATATFGTTDYGWGVTSLGGLGSISVSYTSMFGIRPVITIPKSSI